MWAPRVRASACRGTPVGALADASLAPPPAGQVVELVAGHLDKAQDLLAFSAVCRATRCAAARWQRWQLLWPCAARLDPPRSTWSESPHPSAYARTLHRRPLACNNALWKGLCRRQFDVPEEPAGPGEAPPPGFWRDLYRFNYQIFMASLLLRSAGPCCCPPEQAVPTQFFFTGPLLGLPAPHKQAASGRQLACTLQLPCWFALVCCGPHRTFSPHPVRLQDMVRDMARNMSGGPGDLARFGNGPMVIQLG